MGAISLSSETQCLLTLFCSISGKLFYSVVYLLLATTTSAYVLTSCNDISLIFDLIYLQRSIRTYVTVYLFHISILHAVFCLSLYCT